jgi:hypothetical protein
MPTIRIPLLGPETVTYYRRAPGVHANLDWVPGALGAGVQIVASIQPAKAKDLEVLPEGERYADIYNLYTYSELRTASQYDATNADEIDRGGVRYKVMKAPRWDQLTGHYSCLIARIQEGTGVSGVDP